MGYHVLRGHHGDTVLSTGCPKKMPHFGFCWISLVENILEGWNIFHFKGGSHKSIPSTKTFLCEIRKPRYKLNNIGYDIPNILSIFIWNCQNLSLIFLVLNIFDDWNMYYLKVTSIGIFQVQTQFCTTWKNWNIRKTIHLVFFIRNVCSGWGSRFLKLSTFEPIFFLFFFLISANLRVNFLIFFLSFWCSEAAFFKYFTEICILAPNINPKL